MCRLILTLCLLTGLGGCSSQTFQTCAPGLGKPVSIVTLFLGKAIPGRNDLTDSEWRAFVDMTVTANLPDGYTVFDANGGWMNPATHETIREATKVLLVALPDEPTGMTAINGIRAAYQNQFHQQLVGMTVQQGCADF